MELEGKIYPYVNSQIQYETGYFGKISFADKKVETGCFCYVLQGVDGLVRENRKVAFIDEITGTRYIIKMKNSYEGKVIDKYYL